MVARVLPHQAVSQIFFSQPYSGLICTAAPLDHQDTAHVYLRIMKALLAHWSSILFLPICFPWEGCTQCDLGHLWAWTKLSARSRRFVAAEIQKGDGGPGGGSTRMLPSSSLQLVLLPMQQFQQLVFHMASIQWFSVWLSRVWRWGGLGLFVMWMPHFVWQRRLVLCSARWIFFQFAPRVRENEADRPRLASPKTLCQHALLQRAGLFLRSMSRTVTAPWHGHWHDFFEVCREILRPSERSMFALAPKPACQVIAHFAKMRQPSPAENAESVLQFVVLTFSATSLTRSRRYQAKNASWLENRSQPSHVRPFETDTEIIARVESFKPIVLSKHLETGPIRVMKCGMWVMCCGSCRLFWTAFSGPLQFHKRIFCFSDCRWF